MEYDRPYGRRGQMGGDIEFRILGPLEVRAGGARVRLRGPRQERCIAALLLEPGRSVTLDALVDATWDDPPATARRQVQDLVAGLRRTLSERGHRDRLATERSGYTLHVGPQELDSLVFETLIAAARQNAATDPKGSATILRSALEMCRGSTLAGLVSRTLEPAAARLDELRRVAREDWLELEVRLGSHSVVGELIELVAAHPLHERPVGLLMHALAAAGRTPEALDVFHRFRERLADDLGLYPSPDLRELHRTILQAPFRSGHTGHGRQRRTGADNGPN
jgi:DNA-binding SARP family transcriptional activator